MSLLYIHVEPNIKEWIAEKGLPEGKSWDDYIARDSYRDKDYKNLMNREEADASELFEGSIQSDKPNKRTYLTIKPNINIKIYYGKF